MNLRTLTSFWRKGARKESGGGGASSQTTPQPQPQGRRAAWPFESKQAALWYVSQTLEPAGRSASAPACSLLDEEPPQPKITSSHATTASSSLALLSSRGGQSAKESTHAVKQDREDIFAALELCLFAVPEEVVAVKNGEPVERDNVEDAVKAAANEGHETELFPEPYNAGNDNDVRIITQKDWRCLLHGLVNLLFEIDRGIYAETMMRSHQSTVIMPSFGTSPSPPGKTPLARPEQPLTCLTTEDRESPSTVAHPVNTSAKKGSLLTALKPSSEGNNSDDKMNNDMQKTEGKMALVRSITTWIIMRNIFAKQMEHQDFFACSSVDSPSSAPTVFPIRYDVPVQWEDVIEYLMEALGTSQRKAAEVAISDWMLHDVSGHELVQCILQRPHPELGTTPEGKHRVSGDGVSMNKSTDTSMPPPPSIPLVNNSEDTLDDLVEQVEKIYEQNVVMTWAAYLEQQSYVSLTIKPEFHDLILPSLDLCCCQRMATYAICSPHWPEEKRQHNFQILQKTWDEMNEIIMMPEMSREISPLAVGAWRSCSASIEAGGCASSGLSGIGNTAEMNDVLHLGVEQQKVPPLSQCTSERPPTGSDMEDHYIHSLSAQSIMAGISSAIFPTIGTIYTMFEDDLIPYMTQLLWSYVLHLRVEECLNDATAPRLEEAEFCVKKETEVAHASGSFSCKQRSRESLVKLQISTGNYVDALKTAHLHFTNAKNEWSSSTNCRSYGLSYLNSMVLLAKVQEVSHMDACILETAQLALPQAELCEQTLNDLSSPYGTFVLRWPSIRRGVYNAKLFHLRAMWRVYHRMDDTVNAVKYFEEYLAQIKRLRRSVRDLDAYTALKERGEQLNVEKKYNDAVMTFKQAVEYAKCIAHAASAPQLTTMTAGAGTGVGTTNFHASASASTTSPTKDREMSVNTAGSAVVDANAANGRKREVVALCREAEGERSVALAYVLQAEHEVNVKHRRQQLSNAVNSAYAAQNALQRCISKVKPPSNATLADVASSLIVAAKALLRLGQPKKAALLLEPLIEDKANSASVRPSLWSEGLPQLEHITTSHDLEERMEILQLKIKAYDVHTQCLSKFDGERACREATRIRQFLEEVKAWANTVPLVCEANETIIKDKVSYSVFENRTILAKTIQIANALLPVLDVTCGDALVMLGKLEDALQEYSNALAMYSDRNDEANCSSTSHNNNSNNENKLFSLETEKERERARNNSRMGESSVLAKLAEVYSALNKPKTAIHYHNQVLEYAVEVGDALMSYDARIHLARLYTATGDIGEAEEHWARVSELAKEYEDQEISRETTRNIVASQCAKGMYTDVLVTAKELDALASAAEGVDAAADKRFALEALADAYLQLGQYRECIKTLDERENVQYKSGMWKGTLLSMRARALLGDGAVQDAIKVLVTWANEARQSQNWVEVGSANAVLALAYATSGQVFKARRHHEIVLSAFSEVASMSHEDRNVVMDSARWLVHNFYLNDEEVLLDNDFGEKAVCNSTNKGSHGTASSSSPTGNNNNSNTSNNNNVGGSGAANEFQVQNLSGDLNVLMRQEEIRMKKHQESNASSSGQSSSSRSSSGSNNGTDTSREESGDVRCPWDDDDDIDSGGGGDDSDSDDHDGEVLTNNSISGLDMASILSDGPTVNKQDSNKKKTSLTRKGGKDDHLKSAEKSRAKSPPVQAVPSLPPSSTSALWRSPTTSIAKVSLCNRPSMMEGEVLLYEPNLLDTQEATQESLPPNAGTRVQTLCYSRALETIETAAQVSLMSLVMRQRLIPRNPADTIDLAFLAFPRCTFVFYFAEFATQYVAIVRPAGRSFFLRRSVQAYSLKEFRSKRFVSQNGARQVASSGISELSPHASVERKERGFSAIASSIGSLARKSRINSVEVSTTIPGLNAESTAKNEELLQGLRDLYADLWAPVRDSLRMSRCFNDEAECFVLVLDPTLLHVPFHALHEDSSVSIEPLGQLFTMVVTPTAAQFLNSMQGNEKLSLSNASPEDICVFLPEETLNNAAALESAAPGNVRADGGGSRKPSTATARSSATTSTDDPHMLPTKIPHYSSVATAEAAASFSDTSYPWTLFAGCTRKEIISAFASSSCRALMVLCDPVDHMFKVADGMVRLEDLTRGHPFLSESLNLIVVTNDASTTTSMEELGVAARLCLAHGCRRVLRVDLPPGTSITTEHKQLIRMYLDKLKLTLEWGMRYPYALALRMTQEEALRSHFPPAVWSSLTLLGAS